MSKESGQSTIEFLISIVFGLAFIFTFFRLAIFYTNGYFVHYATFIASRTYLVADNNNSTRQSVLSFAQTQARAAFEEFNVGIFTQSKSGQLSIQAPLEDPLRGGLYVGAKYSFKQPFTIIHLFGGRRILDLTSESFLGREPERATCHQSICQVMGEAGVGTNVCDSLVTLYDDGC